MIKAKIFLIGFAAAAIALVAGIYTGLQQSNPSPQTPPSLSTKSIDTLFTSTLHDANGKPQRLSQWQGKTLVVNFWATWCPPCREEMPAFSRLQVKHAANGVQFVGIALDTADNVREFATKSEVTYPLLIGDVVGADLARALGNFRLALPYTLIITPSGEARFARLGPLSERELDALLQPKTVR